MINLELIIMFFDHYFEQKYEGNGVPILAIPTTAGTGSESTRYAVINYEGKKQYDMDGLLDVIDDTSARSGGLPRLSRLRTVRESFPSYGSSLS